MAKKVQIQKTVLDRTEFKDTIDRNFKFYREPEPVVDPDTVGELFRLYDKLYLDIPIDGETESHQYLVEKSSELYKVDRQLESIQPLLDEIAQLRIQILEANRRVLELETQLANGAEFSFEDAEKVAQLQSDLALANTSIAALEQANAVANSATQAAQEAATAAQAAAQAQQEQQSQQAQPQNSPAVNEIHALFNKKRTRIYNAKQGLEKQALFRLWVFNAGRSWRWNNNARTGVQKFPWLFEDTGDTSYNGQNRYKRLADSPSEAGAMTIEWLVNELEQAGYTAQEIVNAIQKYGNFKGNVAMRLITYNDPDKDPRVGYRYTK